ncbi:MAG: isoprenylcysteine carboxylmethyltransferase family protein [Methylococcales bacterium]|nr:isoprenylcysteine carboxylmethyltransferase family protein [Methylococcales bacterium]
MFAWASLALGFKASNLTARGIVQRGPYRWLRHPAYTAKLGVWWIQGLIFGDFTVGILLAFTVMYGLRAWTEERYLSVIDDYAAYCRAGALAVFSRNQSNQIHQPELVIELGCRQNFPAGTEPTPEPVGPDAPHKSSVKLVAKLADAGTFEMYPTLADPG